jgi:hypothetical protein
MRLGTALRTPITPVSAGTAAIYAVYPRADFRDGTEETAFVLVESVPDVDTCVYPCTRDGQVITLELLAHTPKQSHRIALMLAGYEQEAIVHDHA